MASTSTGLDSSLAKQFKTETISRTFVIEGFQEFLSTFITNDLKNEQLNSVEFKLGNLKSEHFETTCNIFPAVEGKDRFNISQNLKFRVVLKVTSSSIKSIFLSTSVSLLGVNDEELVKKNWVSLANTNELREIFHHRIISTELLKKDKEKYFPENKLKLKCEINYCLQLKEDFSIDLVREETKQLQDLSTNLSNAWINHKFTDVILVVKYGSNPIQEIKAHKMILVAQSAYFSRMLKNPNWSEAQQGKIDITDFESSVVEAALKFMYIPQVKLVEGMEDKLLAIANKWGMKSLKSFCERSLCAMISPKTVYDLIALADIHNATFLKSKALAYFKNNPHLLNSHDELLVEFIRKSAQKRVADEMQNEESSVDGAKKSKN